MAILKGILKESLDYYQDLDNRLRSRLAQLPRGSVLQRRIGRQKYFYLKVREGNQVVSRDLGKDRPIELEKSIQERRLIQRQLQEVQQNLQILAQINKQKSRRKVGRSVS